MAIRTFLFWWLAISGVALHGGHAQNEETPQGARPECVGAFGIINAKIPGLYEGIPVPRISRDLGGGGFGYRVLRDPRTGENIIIKVSVAPDRKDPQTHRVTTEFLVLVSGQPVPALTRAFKPSAYESENGIKNSQCRYRGEFQNSLRPGPDGKYTLVLEGHFSEAPEEQPSYWIPPVEGVVPLVANRGLPPVVVGIAATPKVLGVSPAEITQVRVQDVANIPTLEYVMNRIRPSIIKALAGPHAPRVAILDPGARYLSKTITGIFENGLRSDDEFPFRYIRTALTQLGLRIEPGFSVVSTKVSDEGHRFLRTLDGVPYVVDMDHLDVEFRVTH